MTRHYSALSLIKEGLAHQKGWQQAWRSPEPKARYDAIIIGAGGHGLATAYYLAKHHGISNVAVVDKGWLGGGNTGRNTTTIRSNYFYPESAALYEESLKLYEGLSKELNYNVMFSQRGVLTMVHSKGEMEIAARLVNAMQINGIDSDLVDLDRIRQIVPLYDLSPKARYQVLGAVWQGRAGVARHDAVAWGYARAADRLKVDIIQSCEVTDFIVEGGRCRGVMTPKGSIRADSVGLAVAGHSSQMAAKAGFRLPVISYTLQACVGGDPRARRALAVDERPRRAGLSQQGRRLLPALRRAAVQSQARGGDRRRHRPGAVLCAARQSAGAGGGAVGPFGNVSVARPVEIDAAMGRRGRRDAGFLACYRREPAARPLSQLRLGHRRLQGHSGRRGDAGATDGHRQASRPVAPLRSRPLSDRPADR